MPPFGSLVCSPRPGKNSAKSAAVSTPGRRMAGTGEAKSKTVDSRPARHSPPLIISGILPCISANTCSASVGLGRPERLALGAATGRAASRSSCKAAGWAGIRRPTVFRPPVVTAGSAKVSGPGQKAVIKRRARGETSANSSACHSSAICTISGLSEGRPFT